MDNSTYVSLSLASVAMRELDVTANNIANANTAGFKGERIAFDSYLQGASDDETAFVIDSGSFMDEAQGAISFTGSPLDVALQGPGWFSYKTADGQVAYGRDGRFNVNAQGNLVTLNGDQVLGDTGIPIAIAPDLGGKVVISRDGTISDAEGGTIAKLGVFNLPDLQAYERIGAGRFIAPDDRDVAKPLVDINTEVVQGAVENSNVQPVLEMTRLIAIQRAYERSVKLMGSGDDLRRDMLRRLGRAAG